MNRYPRTASLEIRRPEHATAMVAFFAVALVCGFVFANGLRTPEAVVSIIRAGAANIVAGTSLLHEPVLGSHFDERADRTGSSSSSSGGNGGGAEGGAAVDVPAAVAPAAASDAAGQSSAGSGAQQGADGTNGAGARSGGSQGGGSAGTERRPRTGDHADE